MTIHDVVGSLSEGEYHTCSGRPASRANRRRLYPSVQPCRMARLPLIGVLFTLGTLTVLVAASVPVNSEGELYQRLRQVFESVNDDVSRLNKAHFQQLRALGFTAGD